MAQMNLSARACTDTRAGTQVSVRAQAGADDAGIPGAAGHSASAGVADLAGSEQILPVHLVEAIRHGQPHFSTRKTGVLTVQGNRLVHTYMRQRAATFALDHLVSATPAICTI
jgi:hypothetical protein